MPSPPCLDPTAGLMWRAAGGCFGRPGLVQLRTKLPFPAAKEELPLRVGSREGGPPAGTPGCPTLRHHLLPWSAQPCRAQPPSRPPSLREWPWGLLSPFLSLKHARLPPRTFALPSAQKTPDLPCLALLLVPSTTVTVSLSVASVPLSSAPSSSLSPSCLFSPSHKPPRAHRRSSLRASWTTRPGCPPCPPCSLPGPGALLEWSPLTTVLRHPHPSRRGWKRGLPSICRSGVWLPASRSFCHQGRKHWAGYSHVV